MSASEGLRIITVAKSLEAFQRGDLAFAQYFGATYLAGRAGFLLSSLRNQRRLAWRKFKAHAATAHIDGPTLQNQVVPWLQKSGFIDVASGDNPTVVCNVLDHDAILRATSRFFQTLDPTPEEVAILALLDCGIRAPTLRSKALDEVDADSEDVLLRALDLARRYNILRVLEGPGVSQPVVYSPLVWGDHIGKAGKALANMPAVQREAVLHLIDRVRKYQGLPEASARAEAEALGFAGAVDLAVGVGLLDRTEITTKDGVRNPFLTTPHLYGEIAVEHGRDVCDRVRLFLDSIRHGQHYGRWHTGKIDNPVRLLTRLLTSGEIGPCTAIGSDYILVERAGVVNVQESDHKPGQFVMRLVQEDTVALIRDILDHEERPANMGLVGGGSAGLGQDRFLSAEHGRAQVGELPGPMAEAATDLLRSLREMV